MKKLCALAASLILGAASFGAQAGDHYRHDDHRSYDHGYGHDNGHGRHYDDWHGHGWGPRQVVVREYRPVYYRPAPVRYYSGPVYYYPGPAYGRGHYHDDGDIHGSISIGF